jgi:hypothetical protein
MLGFLVFYPFPAFLQLFLFFPPLILYLSQWQTLPHIHFRKFSLLSTCTSYLNVSMFSFASIEMKGIVKS